MIFTKDSKRLVQIIDNKLVIKLFIDNKYLLYVFLVNFGLILLTILSNHIWIYLVFFMIPSLLFFYYFLDRRYEIVIDNQLNSIELVTYSFNKKVYEHKFDYHEPIEIIICQPENEESDNVLLKHYLILNCINCSHILYEIYFLYEPDTYKNLLYQIDFKYHSESVRVINGGFKPKEKLDNIQHI